MKDRKKKVVVYDYQDHLSQKKKSHLESYMKLFKDRKKVQ
jgi:hypothetical protein